MDGAGKLHLSALPIAPLARDAERYPHALRDLATGPTAQQPRRRTSCAALPSLPNIPAGRLTMISRRGAAVARRAHNPEVVSAILTAATPLPPGHLNAHPVPTSFSRRCAGLPDQPSVSGPAPWQTTAAFSYLFSPVGPGPAGNPGIPLVSPTLR